MNGQRKMRSHFNPMKMVLLTIAAWALFVVVGALAIAFTSQPDDLIQYIAVKELRANHRLVEGDVAEVGAFFRLNERHITRFLIPDHHTRSDFSGRYIVKKVPKNEKIQLFETRGGPRLLSRAGAIVWIPVRDLPAAEIASLDAGDYIDVCNLNNDARCGAFTVEAIACADGTKDCKAAVDLTPRQQKHVWGAPGKEPMSQVHVLTVGGPRNAPVRGSEAHHQPGPGTARRTVDAGRRGR